MKKVFLGLVVVVALYTFLSGMWNSVQSEADRNSVVTTKLTQWSR